MASSQKLRYDRSAAVGGRPGMIAKISGRRRFAMSSPKKAAVAGEPIGRFVAAALLLLGALLIETPPAAADEPPEAYTVTVKVDATAANGVEARRIARLDGQRQALAKVVAQLAGSPEVQLPTLSDDAITDMVDNFEVANEHESAVRYLADYAFHFRPARVRRLMQEAGIVVGGGARTASPAAGAAAANAAEKGGGKPAVILPVFEDGAAVVLWDDPNPWRDAWAQRPERPGPARLIVPLGGVAALTVIDAAQAIAGEAEALGKIAADNGGGDAIVALATVERQGDEISGLAVTVKRYRQGQLTGTQADSFSRNPGEGENDFLQRAVEGTAAAIARGPTELAAASGAPATLTATVPISGLADWIAVRDRLAAVPAVRKVDLLSLNRQQAKIAITYSGTPEQLKSSLADADLDLGGGDPTWQVRPSDAARPR
jgi:Uncharacterized protein conserved in bacteria (DUF2066)